MSLRVTGGEHASRRIKGPKKGQAIRPTPDALRERAFAILAPRLSGARVLDLYAGTGINGIEALSRGADSVLAVELDRRAFELLRSNVTALFGRDHPDFELRRAAAARLVDKLEKIGRQFDLIWVDPPFTTWDQEIESLHGLVELLGENGVLALEAPRGSDLERASASLGGSLYRTISCGDCYLAFMEQAS